jgi:hypothetical protein
MKRITEFRKLYNSERGTTLAELKNTYRKLVKEYHPDKFQEEEKKKEAEEQSKKIIEGYHFLVSISPETALANKDKYVESISNNLVIDFQHKGQVLRLDFSDGNSYEYFGVSRDVYLKLCQSDIQTRFARRKICEVFTYRMVTQQPVVNSK